MMRAQVSPEPVVPARAGMSPAHHHQPRLPARGPRASGDEPAKGGVGKTVSTWSPRERG